MKKRLSIFLAAVCLCCVFGISRAESGNDVTLFIGQDVESVQGYADAFGVPRGVTTYTSLPSLDGLTKRAAWGAGEICAQSYVDDPAYEGVEMAIGLYIVGQTVNIERGLCDTAIRRLGEFIKASGREVYLRIGYEFNGGWNAYPPDSYIAAFRVIMDEMRAQGVTNVRSVWQSSGSGSKAELLRWYPGDEYVDVMGYSYFDGNPLLIGNGILQLAREKNKPVFICEAAPRRDLKTEDGEAIWKKWYEPFLAHIDANRDVIDCVSYINADWESQTMWRGQGWGDSRLQANETVAELWRDAFLYESSREKEQSMTILFEDDFSGSVLDTKNWTARTGNWLTDDAGRFIAPGWGNDELQYYTDNPGNVYVADGCLHLRAVRETSPVQAGKAYAYTSARIDTRDTFSFRYGRVTVRAKLPLGAGLWPALWLMPKDAEYGAWAASGEIDLMEARGRIENEVHGALHFGGVSPENTFISFTHTLPPDDGIARFHEYALEWRENEIAWLVDGMRYATARNWFTPGAAYPAPFDKPFYLIVNLAVGGRYDLADIDNDSLPAEMLIDFIRVEGA